MSASGGRERASVAFGGFVAGDQGEGGGEEPDEPPLEEGALHGRSRTLILTRAPTFPDSSLHVYLLFLFTATHLLTIAHDHLLACAGTLSLFDSWSLWHRKQTTTPRERVKTGYGFASRARRSSKGEKGNAGPSSPRRSPRGGEGNAGPSSPADPRSPIADLANLEELVADSSIAGDGGGDA